MEPFDFDPTPNRDPLSRLEVGGPKPLNLQFKFMVNLISNPFICESSYHITIEH